MPPSRTTGRTGTRHHRIFAALAWTTDEATSNRPGAKNPPQPSLRADLLDPGAGRLPYLSLLDPPLLPLGRLGLAAPRCGCGGEHRHELIGHGPDQNPETKPKQQDAYGNLVAGIADFWQAPLSPTRTMLMLPPMTSKQGQCPLPGNLSGARRAGKGTRRRSGVPWRLGSARARTAVPPV